MCFKKKILFVIPSDTMGGAEQLQVSLAEEFYKCDYKIEILFLLKKQIDININAEIKYLNAKNIILGLLKLTMYDFSNEYHMVLSSQTLINSILGILKNLNKVKCTYLIVRESTDVFNRFKGLKLWCYTLAYKTGYGYANLIICQTNKMKENLVANIKSFSNLNIQVISNPINLEKIKIKEAEPFIDDILVNKKFIVSAGRLIDVKGFDILIKAFAKFSKKYSDYYLIILGDGPLLEELKKEAIKNKIEDKVLFKGFVNNPYPYFKQAKICVVSSRKEGFPNVLLQMMSQNGAVISTLCAGDIINIPQILVCNPNEIDGLFEKMIEITNQNEETLKNNLFAHFSFLKNRTFSNYISSIFEALK